MWEKASRSSTLNSIDHAHVSSCHFTADIWTEVQKVPPVTRTLCGSLLATTGSVVMNLVSPYIVLYNQYHAWNRLQAHFLGLLLSFPEVPIHAWHAYY